MKTGKTLIIISHFIDIVVTMKNLGSKISFFISILSFLILIAIYCSKSFRNTVHTNNPVNSALGNGKIKNKNQTAQKEKFLANYGTDAPNIKKAEKQNADFVPLPKPKQGDWLSIHHEPGQTLKEYNAMPHNIPDEKRHIIYLQPLEKFHHRNSPSLKKLQEFTQKYFQLKVKILKPPKRKQISITTRRNPYTYKKQYLTSDILEYLREHMPDDAFCVMAITMVDLYPEDSWNYVFGIATFTERVGAFSFARCSPKFYNNQKKVRLNTEEKRLLLKRSCKMISHETGHMFGMMHCITYHCNMNGSNHMGESDSQPLNLCPVCLSKLQSSIYFSITNRYKQLGKFYSSVQFNAESSWTQRRVASLIKISR